ncbi:hypothetical protein C8R46DRAFT_81903 [Mycena filopes]|nr:hypothetical protein C8R46DRAFT_81903 [Mycena filopes]
MAMAMYGLTRTDTRASDVSGIAFALPALRAHQKAVSPDPPTPPPVDVQHGGAVFGGQQQQQRQRQRMNSKLARTLGAEVPFQWGIGAQAARMARRSSVSVPESPAPTDTDATTASSSARRQSSYGSLLLQHSRDNSSTSLSSEYRGDVWEPEEGYKRSTPGTPPFGAYYPAPPSPFLAALNPDSSEYEDDADDASEILSFHADHDIEFASLYSDPPETDDGYGFGDGDGEDGFEFEFGGGALTPMGGTRAGTPVSIALSAEDRQRFESPFQVMPLFVLPWEPAASAPQPDDGREEGGAWGGEWNRADMQVVIRGLRGLRG